MDDKGKIEAVLFVTGKWMTEKEIAEVSGIDVNNINSLLNSLAEDYTKREGALMIDKVEDRWKLNIRKEYGSLTNRLVSDSEMDSPTTKTLAVIAYKNPVTQAEVIKIRGNKAYDHIERLKEEGLITSEKQGRTRLLKLTAKFYDYFDTAEEKVKEMFNKIKEHGLKEETENEDKKEAVENQGINDEEMKEELNEAEEIKFDNNEPKVLNS